MKSLSILSHLFALTVLVLVCLACIVHAREEQPPSHSFSGAEKSSDAAVDNAKKVEAWLISFLDNAEDVQFEKTVEHIKSLNRPITESVNESYIKFLVANLTKNEVEELENRKTAFGIESIELDDLVWDSMDKSEL